VSQLLTTFCRPVLFPCRSVCEPAVRGIPHYQGFDHVSRRGCAQSLPKIVFAYQLLPPRSDRGPSIVDRPRRGWELPAAPLSRSRLHRLVQKRNGPILWLLLGRGVAGPEQNSLQPSLLSKGVRQP
jgi:hypothetical protein